MVFEPDVNPVKGVAKLRQLRQSGAPGFLPGRAAVAANTAKEALARDLNTEDSPSFSTVLVELVQRRVDALQLAVVILASGAWVAIAYAWAGPRLDVWRTVTYATFTIVIIMVAATLRAQSQYFDYLRWGKREWRLIERVVAKQVAERAGAAGPGMLSVVHRELEALQGSMKSLDELAEQVTDLQLAIERLNARLSERPPRRRSMFRC